LTLKNKEEKKWKARGKERQSEQQEAQKTTKLKRKSR